MRLYLLTSSRFLIKSNKFRGWSERGAKGEISTPFDSFTMSFLIAVSSNWIYGVMGNELTNDANVFQYFLSKVCQIVTDVKKRDCSRWCYVMDNASIHKTKAIQEFSEKSKISIVTIPPYCPSLNAAEMVIQSIKAKLRSFVGRGK